MKKKVMIVVGLLMLSFIIGSQKSEATGTRQDIVNEAHKYLGVPYVLGGTTPNGFDCSGLVQYVFRQQGYSLPRVTTEQEYAGTVISVAEAQPGDIYFFGSRGRTSHDAIAIGGGNFIHAPTTGDVVKITNIKYFKPDFAVRIISNTPPVATHKAIVISPFNENEALDRLAEFRKAMPHYEAFLKQLPNKTQYELVVQPFTVNEVQGKLSELNNKFPGWSKQIVDLRDVAKPQGVLISPFTGSDVAEKYLEIKQKTGYMTQITGNVSGQVDKTKKAVVISPFNENEALDRLQEFRKAFPSYSAFLMQLPNKTQYQLVVQPFTPSEVASKVQEFKVKFPGWSMITTDLQDVVNQRGVMISPFNGKEAGERYLEIKQKTGYIMQLVDA